MIAHRFYLRGKMEKKGRGLLLIKNHSIEYGLRAPEWITKNGNTYLTLYGVPKPIPVNGRMIEFVKKLKTGKKFTRKEYEQYFTDGISEKTARNDITGLMIIMGKIILHMVNAKSTEDKVGLILFHAYC